MCGRFVLSTSTRDLAVIFNAQADDVLADDGDRQGIANFNISPTTDIVAVTAEHGNRHLERFHWGLVPSWAKDPSIGSRTINARAETVATKPSFRAALRKRRCIIPADGFYEWLKVPGQRVKHPMYFHPVANEPFAFAGLWESWQSPSSPNEVLRSCTIITCMPNEIVEPIHDRMPVILPKTAWDTWLSHGTNEVDALQVLLVPAEPSIVAVYPVSTAVNNARNHGSMLVERLDHLDVETIFDFDADPEF